MIICFQALRILPWNNECDAIFSTDNFRSTYFLREFRIRNGIVSVSKELHSLHVDIQFIRMIFISSVKALKSIDARIFIALVSILMSSGIAIVCCYVGSYTTKKYLRFADVSYESLWYRVPTHLQKYLVPILADAQRLQVFNGLGIIDVNLIAFMKVCFTVINFRRK